MPPWKETISDPSTWSLVVDGSVVAEVVRDDDGRWRWYRRTSIAEHGVPPAGGIEDDRRTAQRRAMAGLAPKAAS